MPLVEGHQEAHGASPSIVAGRGGVGALALHESRHVPVQLELGAVDAGDRQPEVRVELPGDSKRVRLQSQPQQLAIAVVPEAGVEDRQLGQILRGERYLAEALGPRADQAERPARRSGRYGVLHPHRLVEQRAGQDLAFARGHWRTHWQELALDATVPPGFTVLYHRIR